ncbi:hypothetical protein ACIRSF_00455 [Streptomyces rubiginosohelvolus]|uniref:hypothetical protein n=1 Tax=Streptomyces rubiginosohelvolus TaxID=67362 RepID=UPI0038063CEC
MTTITDSDDRQRFCKACGTPAGAATLCENCRAVFPPTDGGLSDDEGAAARRVFEGKGKAADQ